MGINFPIENVIFAQLQKNDGCISKNLFEQLAGRAGRKGFFDEGHVYFTYEIEDDLRRMMKRAQYYDEQKPDFVPISKLYSEILFAENEDLNVLLQPDFKKILLGKITVNEEAEFISKFSSTSSKIENIQSKIQNKVNMINNYSIEGHIKMRHHDDTLTFDDRNELNFLK